MCYNTRQWLAASLCTLSFAIVLGKPRHIVFIVADDLGWNDVGFHNPDMITPNIDKLAYRGVILNNSYVQPVCTPSRNSWMTGVYPFKVGLQRGVIAPGTTECSPLNREFFPQKLQKLGYATHMVGKWHLGSCSWNCTPTYRGFDSFYGYYYGAEDYYTKIVAKGIDFHDGEKSLNDTTYSAYLYAERAKTIIKNHDKSRPLFLYLPFQSVHSPIQVPKRFEDMYLNIKTERRKKYCGMVSALDEAIGNVTKQLADSGLINDTLIIFTADNGGIPTASGNNYPLRGAKSTVFEGGTRAASFIVGSGIKKSGYTYDGLIHAVDWHPTIVTAAGGTGMLANSSIDGINQWESISVGGKSKRNEIVYNLDNAFLAQQGHAAIRVGNFKLIQGYPGPFRDWYKPEQVYKDNMDTLNENEYYKRLVEQDFMTLKGYPGRFRDRYELEQVYKIKSDTSMSNEMENYSRQGEREFMKQGGIWSGEGLYDLRNDPTEHYDLTDQRPDIVKILKAKLDKYRQSLVEPKRYPYDPRSDPAKFGGYWTSGWC